MQCSENTLEGALSKRLGPVDYVNILGENILIQCATASLILMFKASERYWMASHLVVASEYLPPLC